MSNVLPSNAISLSIDSDDVVLMILLDCLRHPKTLPFSSLNKNDKNLMRTYVHMVLRMGHWYVSVSTLRYGTNQKMNCDENRKNNTDVMHQCMRKKTVLIISNILQVNRIIHGLQNMYTLPSFAYSASATVRIRSLSRSIDRFLCFPVIYNHLNPRANIQATYLDGGH